MRSKLGHEVRLSALRRTAHATALAHGLIANFGNLWSASALWKTLSRGGRLRMGANCESRKFDVLAMRRTVVARRIHDTAELQTAPAAVRGSFAPCTLVRREGPRAPSHVVPRSDPRCAYSKGANAAHIARNCSDEGCSDRRVVRAQRRCLISKQARKAHLALGTR